MIVSRVDVDRQAQLMLTRLAAVHPGVFERLSDDAIAELGNWTELQLKRVPDTQTRTRCSVAGGYTHTTKPPTLLIANSLSVRRRQFTALHELGHHLQKNDAQLALAVRRQRGDNDTFEDAACDTFASRVLIPDDLLSPRTDCRSPSAADVVELFDRTQASRAACAVRIAQSLGTHGTVTVLDANGVVSFAAAHGEVFPPARDTSQAHTPLVATALRSHRNARVDDTYITYRDGSRSELLYGDAAWSGDYLVYVAVRDLAGWRPFSPPRTTTHSFTPRWWTCEVCEDEFTAAESCHKCHTPRCPIGHCRCTAAAERMCQGCFTMLAPARFTSRESKICRDCAD